MNPTAGLQQQARQAATQGQQMLAQDRASANQYQGQYNQAYGQAGADIQKQRDYTNYMQGAGSGTNLYNQGLSSAQQMYGFDPQTLARATQNLTQSQNALGQLNQASQSSMGGYGLSGAQLGSMYSSAAQPLSSQISAQSNAVGNLQGIAGLAQTQANQAAGLGLQGEQLTSGNLQNIVQNSQAQASSAAQQMQFFNTLAQQQGGLNAQQQQAYQAAVQAYAQSQQALAQAGLAGAQAQGQGLQNQLLQYQVNAVNAKGTPSGVKNPVNTPAGQAIQNYKSQPVKPNYLDPTTLMQYLNPMQSPISPLAYLAGNR